MRTANGGMVCTVPTVVEPATEKPDTDSFIEMMLEMRGEGTNVLHYENHGRILESNTARERRFGDCLDLLDDKLNNLKINLKSSFQQLNSMHKSRL